VRKTGALNHGGVSGVPSLPRFPEFPNPKDPVAASANSLRRHGP